MIREAKHIYETPDYRAVTDEWIEGGHTTVEGYGIYNIRTGIREMEVRREDLAIDICKTLQRLREDQNKPMSDQALASIQPINERAV